MATPTNTKVVFTRQWKKTSESGILSLVAKDDAEMSISGDYSNTADIALGGTFSGKITAFQLTSAEVGTGAVQNGTGKVFFFDADPNIVSSDVAMAAAGAEHKTVLGIVDIAAADWNSDANGAVCFKGNIDIAFHSLATIYAVYRNTDGTAVWNSDAADDETLDINVWYETDAE